MHWARMGASMLALASLSTLAVPSGAYAMLPAPAEAALPIEKPVTLSTLQQQSQDCVYCHIITGQGGKIVYGGDLAEYEQASDHAHSAARTPCLECHVPHDEAGMEGPLASKHLRVRDYQRELVRDLAGGDAEAITNGTARADGWKRRDIQLTAFCSSCHPVYASSATERIVVRRTSPDGLVTEQAFSHHPLRAASDSWRGSGSVDGVRIAGASSAGCRTCHGAGVTDAGVTDKASFPHSTPDDIYFLLSAPDASSPATGPDDPMQDGVCLRCHRWTEDDVTRGVGIDY